MKNLLTRTVSTIATVAFAASLAMPAMAGGLFGEGGLIRGDVGNFLDEHVEQKVTTPIAKGVERTAQDIGKTIEKSGKAVIAVSGLKVLEDTLIEGKSLDKALKESLADIKGGVVAAADSFKIPNHMENAFTEATRNALGKEAGRAMGLILLPEQIARSLPGATAEALISVSEKADNVDHIVGIPLASAIKQAKQYYESKAQPLTKGMMKVLVMAGTFDKEHLKNVRYVVDSDGGTIAGLINGLKDVMGDIHEGNHAVAIDNIIVFAKEPGGVSNLFFWAHEIQHTVQYAKVGIDGFAAEYTKDYKALEREADDVAVKTVESFKDVVAALGS